MKSQSVTPKPDAELAKWCEMLSSPSVTAEEVPKGWFTVAQLAQKWGKAECTTGERIRRLFNEGKVERKNFTVQLEQRVRPVPHYKLK